MKPANENIDLIIKSLNNEITESEKNKLNQWLEKPQNKNIFDDYKTIWELTENKIDNDVAEINIDEELNFVRNKLGFKKPKIQKIKKTESKNNFVKYAIAVAASVLVLIGILFWINNRTDEIISDDRIVETTLPDNSKIIINRNSKIEYPKKFENNRTVKLKGEAYFVVSAQKDNPFIVETENYNVEVLGTEFFVSTLKKQIEVIVKKGIVKVYPIKKPADSIILKPDDKLQNADEITKIKNNNFLSWKTGKIKFDNATLKEIANVLTRTYGLEISISNAEIEDLKMTATFDNQELSSVLKVVEQTLNVKITKQKNKIIIYK